MVLASEILRPAITVIGLALLKLDVLPKLISFVETNAFAVKKPSGVVPPIAPVNVILPLAALTVRLRLPLALFNVLEKLIAPDVVLVKVVSAPSNAGPV